MSWQSSSSSGYA